MSLSIKPAPVLAIITIGIIALLALFLYSQFFAGQPALNTTVTTASAPTQTTNANELSLPADTNQVATPSSPTVADDSQLSPAQAALSGLENGDNPPTDELLREVAAMNAAMEKLLATPDLEDNLQRNEANAIQAEALALIREVDAELGIDSIAIADEAFAQSSIITDPQLQQIADEGDQLEAKIATLSQALQ